MASKKLKFFKVNSLPGTFEADSIYLYRDTQDHICVAVTDSSGSIVYTTHNSDTINNLIYNYLNNIVNEPNGILQLDSNGLVPSALLPIDISSLDRVTIEGPAEVGINTTNTYKITNYSNFLTYTISTTTPGVNVTRAGDTIYVSSGPNTGVIALSVNTEIYNINCVTNPAATITPLIIAPVSGINNIGPVVDVTTNYASTTVYSTSPLANHQYTKWEVSYDANFGSIVYSVNDYTNLTGRIFSGTAEGIVKDTKIYIRCKFFFTDTTISNYSYPISFITKQEFVPNKIDSTLINSESAAGCLFGYSVAVNADGTKIVVGSPGAAVGTGSNTGAVYIFTKNSNVWIQEAILIASDRKGADYFGWEVEMSLTGDRVIIGAYKADPGGAADAGRAYIFSSSNGIWTEEAQLLASDLSANDYFGWAVALDGTATRAVVGAYCANTGSHTDSGKAYVFTRSGTTWTQEAILNASDKAASDFFGYTVAMDMNAIRVFVGAPQANPNSIADAGKVYVYTRSGTSWTQEAILTATVKTAGDKFGCSIATSAYGDTIVIGANSYNDVGATDCGAAYVFTRTDTSWTQTNIITASDRATSDNFGWIVDIDASGTRIAVGAYNKTVQAVGGAGKAYIYSKVNINWVEEPVSLISPGVFTTGSQFAYSLSLNSTGDTIVVGEPRATVGGRTTAGKIHVFN